MHFANLGYAPPHNTNPADHLMTILNDDDIRVQAFLEGKSISSKEVKEKFNQRLDIFVSAYLLKEKLLELEDCNDTEFDLLLENKRNPGFFNPRRLVIQRFYKIYFRNPLNAFMNVFQFAVMVLINLVVYADTTNYDDTTTIAISDTNGLFYNLVLLLCLSAIAGQVSGITPLIPKFMRDHEKRLYSPTMFYMTSTIYKIPIFLLMVAFAVIASSLFLNIDTGDNWVKVPQYYLVGSLTFLAAAGVGDFLSVLFQDVQLANQMFPLFVVPFMLTAGFMARVRDMVFYLQGYSYLSMIKFGF